MALHEAGAGDGYLVVFHHGTPSSGVLHRPWVEDAQARGIRLVGFDRPGYGRSTRRPGRAVADVAADVEAIADALGVERFATWGISGGAPHALACAALLPDRVDAAASLAAVAPYDADGLDWLAGMGQDNVEEFGAALEGRVALERWMEENVPPLLASDAETLADTMRSLLTPVDAAALTGELAAFLLGSMTEGVSGGAEGWIDDDLAFVAPWGFDVSEIRVPVQLRHGEHDRFVPPSHGAWLSEQIPSVEAHLSADDGHLTLMRHRVPEVQAWLLAHANH